jgi:hypothetical protein
MMILRRQDVENVLFWVLIQMIEYRNDEATHENYGICEVIESQIEYLAQQKQVTNSQIKQISGTILDMVVAANRDICYLNKGEWFNSGKPTQCDKKSWYDFREKLLSATIKLLEDSDRKLAKYFNSDKSLKII